MLRKNHQRLTAVVEYTLRSVVQKVGGFRGASMDDIGANCAPNDVRVGSEERW